MIALIALRNLAYRPARSLFLLAGYGVGVGVMIVLLAIGEAMLAQAREERLIGGGSITVLPEGLDVEVMKTGGVGGLYFSIDNARFVYRQLLASPRLAAVVTAAAPQIDGKLLYVRAGGREIAVRASGEVPSRNAAVSAPAAVRTGRWRDDDGDRRWIAPTPRELYDQIDHFHEPPAGVAHPESWAEWHYFNVLSDDGRHWAFISFIVGGDVRGSQWGGKIAVTVQQQGHAPRRFASLVPASKVEFSTEHADVAIGVNRVSLEDDGSYALNAVAYEEGGTAPVTVRLVVTPAPNAFFPGATLASGAFTSGYAVAGLRASAAGELCVAEKCEHFTGAPAYHDHNWGVWRSVTWDWGATRAGSYTILYGRVEPPDSVAEAPPFFVYVVDSLGFRALFRPRTIDYTDGRSISVAGRRLRVPSHALLADVRGRDTLRLELDIDDAIATDTRTPLIERGDMSGARALERPYFIQMKGRARLSGRAGGAPVAGEGRGFFETYR